MKRAYRAWAVPAVAIAAMVGSGAWMLTQGQGVGVWGSGAVDGYGMMGDGGFGGAESGGDRAPVPGLAEARTRAQTFAANLGPGMTVGEVMQFQRQYYAELVQPDGSLATEVLIDPGSGAVQIEPGPARMWNTRYGMMGRRSATAEIDAVEAQQIADRWLAGEGGAPALTAGAADAFPGYYTLHTLRDGQVEGMLSVDATTGDVWYHSWHGGFVAMSEEP